MIPLETIKDIAAFIAGRFDVERVILFGSHARGDAGPDSDVDLLVVSQSAEFRDGCAAPILAAVGRRYRVPIDIFVRTPDGVERFKDEPCSLVHEALKEGVAVYAA